MSDMLRKGSAWLERTRKRHATQEVVLRRASSSATVRATVGKTDFPVNLGDGQYTTMEVRDYLIDVCDYQFDDAPTQPAPGDQIIEGDLSQGVVYEVMALPNEDVWRYSDPYRRTYRIHTKLAGLQP